MKAYGRHLREAVTTALLAISLAVNAAVAIHWARRLWRQVKEQWGG